MYNFIARKLVNGIVNVHITYMTHAIQIQGKTQRQVGWIIMEQDSIYILTIIYTRILTASDN